MPNELRKPDDIATLVHGYLGLLEQTHRDTGPSTLVEFELSSKKQVIGFVEELTISPTILHVSLCKVLDLVSTIVPVAEVTTLDQPSMYLLCNEDNLIITIETSKI